MTAANVIAVQAAEALPTGIWTASSTVRTPGEALSPEMFGVLMVPQAIALLLLVAGIYYVVRKRRDMTYRIFSAGIISAMFGFCAIFGTTRYVLDQPRTELLAYAYTGTSFTAVAFDDKGRPSGRKVIEAKLVGANGVPLANGDMIVQALFDDGSTQEMTLDPTSAVKLVEIIQAGDKSSRNDEFTI
jgi:hypothetical protein